MKQNEKIYIAYGSNMNIEQMELRCPTAKVIGTGTLEGYELLFRGNYRNNAVATVEPKENSSVPVVLWSIKPKDERALDRYEGFPHLYYKEVLIVNFNSENVPGMAYIMSEGHKLSIPAPGYERIIRDGYIQNKLDTKALDLAVSNAKEKAGKNTLDCNKNWTCPKCGKTTNDIPAISRLDNTEICSDCGTKESLEAMGASDELINNVIKLINTKS